MRKYIFEKPSFWIFQKLILKENLCHGSMINPLLKDIGETYFIYFWPDLIKASIFISFIIEALENI